MKLFALRSFFALTALTVGTGIIFADEPPAASAPPAATSTPAPAAPSPELVKKAKEAGLKPELHKGFTVFCWEDANIGSPFKTKKCVDENQVEELIAQRQAQKDALNRGGGNYAGSK
jgi:hypothetical protein